MKGFKLDIDKATKKNSDYRRVLYTSKYSQLVLMSLKPKEEIGEEIHESNDQFFRVEAGKGLFVIDGNEHVIGAGDAFVVPTGAKHNVINTGTRSSLKMYTIYSPPHHKDGLVRATKEEAENCPAPFDGVLSE